MIGRSVDQPRRNRHLCVCAGLVRVQMCGIMTLIRAPRDSVDLERTVSSSRWLVASDQSLLFELCMGSNSKPQDQSSPMCYSFLLMEAAQGHRQPVSKLALSSGLKFSRWFSCLFIGRACITTNHSTGAMTLGSVDNCLRTRLFPASQPRVNHSLLEVTFPNQDHTLMSPL